MEQQQLFEEFFEPLLGSENLALTDRGRRIAWTIFCAATREDKKFKQGKVHVQEPKSEGAQAPQNIVNESATEKGDVTKTLNRLKKDLLETIDLFQKVSDARDEFLAHFYGWSFLRLKCIAELKHLKTSLDYALYRCDVSEAVTGAFKFAAGK
ncbi:uncharacterized protein NPIL_360241 [Nephila pilipes]|uniref:Uncharacterized protein n=1 Tax=Nephila pilipes TaxID=299642 RepID=A0A8X6P9D2_NEPPI|nr:uncharacterized protein NPIL_360241 [Nephila pilipes]